jgi:hypothetical protein
MFPPRTVASFTGNTQHKIALVIPVAGGKRFERLKVGGVTFEAAGNYRSFEIRGSIPISGAIDPLIQDRRITHWQLKKLVLIPEQSPLPTAQAMASLYPVYVRGEAHLEAGHGQQAAVEFQKLIDHRSILQTFVLGALAHLQLGRAKTMGGDKDGARKSYQDFFALWKDADPDIPILKEAKAEYAKLQ